jgi:hypothetical protein
LRAGFECFLRRNAESAGRDARLYGRRDACRYAAAADFKDLVPFVDEELIFVVGEIAIGIERFGFDGVGIGGGLSMFFEEQNFPIQTGKGVDKAGVFHWVFSKFRFKANGREIIEDLVVVAGDDLEGGFRQRGGVTVGDQVLSGLAVGADQVEAVVAGEMILIASIVPAGDIHF